MLRSVLTDHAPNGLKQISQFETATTPSTFRCSLILQSVTVLQFPSDFFFFPFSSKRLTVLQDLVHRYVPFWRAVPQTVIISFSLKVEFHTEISTYVFHSKKTQLIWISRQNTRTANVSIIFKTYQMISKFHLYIRTDVESYFVIGQLHVN